jgi:hypothetical protein
MIAFSRIASIAPGKLGEAMAFAHEAAAFVKSKTGVEVQLSTPIGGNPNRICFYAEYADLAAFEQGLTKLGGDRDYQALFAKGAALFIAGSLRDEIWRTVS